MSSSSAGFPPPDSTEASSSRDIPIIANVDNAVDIEDDDDNDPIASHARDETLLSLDPLNDEANSGISFKRRQKSPSSFSFSKFLPSPLSNSSRQTSPLPRQANGQSRGHRRNRSLAERTSLDDEPLQDRPLDSKDGDPLDWYVEGPGRRVGYDNLTAIDWIFEYTKERQRLRVLSSSTQGIVGSALQLLDASQVWLVLIATGIAAGVLAAAIDIVSDWLGDIKNGYCKTGPGGGRFYLNKAFCCWGHDEWSQCQEWTPWSDALHVGNRAGGYIVEYIFFILFSVFFAACASVLVGTYSIYAKQSGIPEIKTVLGGFVIKRFLGTWTLITKSLGLCLSVASGLWLGKEGPLVHVACCCANVFMKFFDNISKNEARKREVFSAAAAAGISVAFGSPIGGVLFSLEQLSYYFPDKTMWQSFVCAMVAAVTLQALNPFRSGKLVLYQVTYSSGWHAFELVPFVLLGILGGLYGGAFIKLNMKVANWRKTSRFVDHPLLEVTLFALITALVNFPIMYMRAQVSELVFALFAECSALTDDQLGLCKTGAANAGVIALLLVASVLGFLFAAVTFGLQIPSGVLLPSMAIGALYGRAIGLVMEIVQSSFPKAFIFSTCEQDIACVTPGTYAIIGAASAVAGLTRMTVSIVVIMFELTGALTYVLPIMIAVMISKWIGDAFGKRGIYESWIHLSEYPFLDNSDDYPIPDVAVSHVMTRIEDLVVISASGHTIESLNQLLTNNPHRGFPVISDTRDSLLLGYISRTELAFALNSAVSSPRNLPPTAETFFSSQSMADPTTTLDLRPWMDHTPITLDSKSSLQLAVNLFQRLGLRYVLFCNRGTLQGLLTKKDVWYILNGAEEDRHGASAGIPRENEGSTGEERGLLGADEASDGTESVVNIR
ncbi:hypothetical protein L228DRAFT_256268 [Xylona heveae TC161]|uniref:Chloride channel protein n=1 Tax=Xylona heveae (strain CBS 132557 / TC161) TaxID=1328760 RepID=A0A165G112_XYLHT|nr:hypothetical protein L228DRAFT_256268 [Xylona heveae TC161]KZF21614.1 hypothetical protein L228DRAFT_256268 [Xylona heveae TC161]